MVQRIFFEDRKLNMENQTSFELSDIPRIVITSQPSPIWYKDVGVKKDTFLTVGVKLEGQLPLNFEVELKLDLYFEDRKRVGDKFQGILQLCFPDETKSKIIIVNREAREAMFRFRINKVSKSFMNQKFRVRCFADPKGRAEEMAFPSLNEVFSNPIESRSKRPSMAKSRTILPPLPNKESDITQVLKQLQETQAKLSNTHKAMNSALLVLEQFTTRLDAVETVFKERDRRNDQINLRKRKHQAALRSEKPKTKSKRLDNVGINESKIESINAVPKNFFQQSSYISPPSLLCKSNDNSKQKMEDRHQNELLGEDVSGTGNIHEELYSKSSIFDFEPAPSGVGHEVRVPPANEMETPMPPFPLIRQASSGY